MKYGQIAPGSNVNAAIYRCFDFVSEKDARQFVKKFADQPHDGAQIMHTFRELVIGAYMGSRGLTVHSEPDIDGKTPDWLIEPDAILELVNFHAPQSVEDDIRAQVASKGSAAYFAPPNTDRLYDRIRAKAGTYANLIETRPYIVAVFGDFQIEIEDDEIDECLTGEHSLFTVYPSLSGVVLFVERSGIYCVRYIANPQASNPFAFPEGSLDLRAGARA